MPQEASILGMILFACPSAADPGSTVTICRDFIGFWRNQGQIKPAETERNLAGTAAIGCAKADQTGISVKYLSGNKLRNRGVVFTDFEFAGAEIPGSIDAPGVDAVPSPPSVPLRPNSNCPLM